MRARAHPNSLGIVANGPDATTPRVRLLGVVGRLGSVNVAVLALGVITAPLQARALGPEGRGLLAAIMVPVTLAPWIAGLGLSQYATREVARGRHAGTVFASSVAATLPSCALLLVLAAPIASLVAGGRDVVYTYVLLGLFLVPLSISTEILGGVAQGRQEWSRLASMRMVPAVLGTISVVVLYVSDSLTVETAAITFIVAGLLAVVPLLPLLRQMRPFKAQRAVAGEGLRFGVKAWVAILGNLANVRLDQLLMIRLVDERQLGLYAVSLTISSLPGQVTSALSTGVFPRVAAGERSLPARVLRITLAAALLIGLGLALITLPLLEIVFGSDFLDAAPMIWILLAAGIPVTGVRLLSTSLTSGGRPGAAAYGEVVALAITVPGLLLLLQPLGGVGAAIVSLLAYTASFVYLLVVARRHFAGTFREFLIPTRADASSVADAVRSEMPRARGRR
jgi:O-antigen/teichoic acid export membrane protein